MYTYIHTYIHTYIYIYIYISRRPIENSLEAYELAWTSGLKLCECDVAVSRDGALVLGHDADYSRLALQVSNTPRNTHG